MVRRPRDPPGDDQRGGRGRADAPGECSLSREGALAGRSAGLTLAGWVLAACVCDGANNRNDPGRRRSSSAARCSEPVASSAKTGDPPPMTSFPSDPGQRATSAVTPAHRPALAGRDPPPIEHLVRIDHTIDGHSLQQPGHETPPSTSIRGRTRPSRLAPGRAASFNAALTSYQLMFVELHQVVCRGDQSPFERAADLSRRWLRSIRRLGLVWRTRARRSLCVIGIARRRARSRASHASGCSVRPAIPATGCRVCRRRAGSGTSVPLLTMLSIWPLAIRERLAGIATTQKARRSRRPRLDNSTHLIKPLRLMTV